VEKKKFLVRDPHPPCFFVRVANKGVMVDVAGKSGRESA
jgi:hypothetical protein